MKKLFHLFPLVLLFCISFVSAQEIKQKLYDPGANAEKDLLNIMDNAKKSNKHIFIMAGGNWCSWCLRFNDTLNKDKQLDSIIKADYIIYHLNYSKENKNLPIMAKLGYPQRFGFPVFIITDENGNRLHTQNSALLEEGKGYNKEKVKEFLLQWNRTSIDPLSYKEN